MSEQNVNLITRAVQPTLKPHPGVKNILAVASGKGGVGKSTTAVNLALTLKAQGYQVGILDADLYGPSIPLMLGLQGQHPVSHDNKTLEPLRQYGLQVMSIGFLIDDSQATIWRGPMASKALQQLIRDTNWSDLDFLILDLPPGTGDIQLTLAQKVPLAGLVVVTTPQDMALIDVTRCITMFTKVHLPLLGLIENMSLHVCSQCGHSEQIFPGDGALKIGLPLLGRLPLSRKICADTEAGKPTVESAPQSEVSGAYRDIVKNLLEALAQRPKDVSDLLSPA